MDAAGSGGAAAAASSAASKALARASAPRRGRLGEVAQDELLLGAAGNRWCEPVSLPGAAGKRWNEPASLLGAAGKRWSGPTALRCDEPASLRGTTRKRLSESVSLLGATGRCNEPVSGGTRSGAWSGDALGFDDAWLVDEDFRLTLFFLTMPLAEEGAEDDSDLDGEAAPLGVLIPVQVMPAERGSSKGARSSEPRLALMSPGLPQNAWQTSRRNSIATGVHVKHPLKQHTAPPQQHRRSPTVSQPVPRKTVAPQETLLAGLPSTGSGRWPRLAPLAAAAALPNPLPPFRS